VTHSSLAHFPSITPDVLILPSLLRPFARVVDSTVFLNPGAAARASATDVVGAGSFARVDVAGMKKARLEALAEEERVGHEAWDRTRVELLRI
jgi:DNA polymerase alpha subunit B